MASHFGDQKKTSAGTKRQKIHTGYGLCVTVRIAAAGRLKIRWGVTNTEKNWVYSTTERGVRQSRRSQTPRGRAAKKDGSITIVVQGL